MPNRILKDSICTSPNIDTLSREGRGMGLQMLAKCGILAGAKTLVPATAFLLPCLIRLGAKPTLLASGIAVAYLCLRKPSTASRVGFARSSAGGRQ